MREHELKTEPPYFQLTIDGLKPFEIRDNDRGFEIGDIVWQREWTFGAYTGRSCRGRITYILDSHRFGLRPGFVALAVALLEVDHGGNTIGSDPVQIALSGEEDD